MRAALVGGLVVLAGGCKQPEPTGLPAVSPTVAVPPGGPRFVLEMPESFRWAEERTQEELGRCWRALRDFYGFDAPYQWRIVYDPDLKAGAYDLPRLPVYEGDGQVRLSVDYLSPPPADPDSARAAVLGTIEGLAYGFHQRLGMEKTDLNEGLAVFMARNLAPGLWGGMGAGEMNALVLTFQEEEDRNLGYWRENGRPPEGVTERDFARQRAVALWRTLGVETSAGIWAQFFARMRVEGFPLTRVSDRRQAHRVVLDVLRGLTKQDYSHVFKQYGYET